MFKNVAEFPMVEVHIDAINKKILKHMAPTLICRKKLKITHRIWTGRVHLPQIAPKQ